MGGRSPLHVLFGRPPVTILRVADVLYIPSPAQDKLSPTSHPVSFLEWGWGTPRLKQKGYKCEWSFYMTIPPFVTCHVFRTCALLRSSGLWPVCDGGPLRGEMREFTIALYFRVTWVLYLDIWMCMVHNTHVHNTETEYIQFKLTLCSHLRGRTREEVRQHPNSPIQ